MAVSKSSGKTRCNGCNATCWAKSLLVIMNAVFVIIGLIIFLLGLVLIMGYTIKSGYLESLFKAVPGESFSTLGGFFTFVAAMIITLGIIVFTMGTLGICGIRSRTPTLLNVYAGIMIFLLIVEITAVILCATMTSWVNDKLSAGLQTSIEENYAGSEAEDSVSTAWNYAFVTFECCGTNNYKDLHKAVKWNRTSDEIPVTCCKLKSTGFPDYGDPVDWTCKSSPSTTNSNYMEGCFDALKDRVKQHLGAIIGVSVAILCIQLILIISAFLVSRKRKKTTPA